MDTIQKLQHTIDDMVDGHRGILAADESAPTIAKRFAAINLESTEENRRAYRSLLLETPVLGEFISGVILFEETLGQKNAADTPLPEVAWSQKIVPGIKVDMGITPLAVLSVLLLAALGLPSASTATPAGIVAVTVPRPVISLTASW